MFVLVGEVGGLLLLIFGLFMWFGVLLGVVMMSVVFFIVYGG